MCDVKQFGKKEKQLDSLVYTRHVVSTDIGMQFGFEKCGILTLKRGKIVGCEGIKLWNGEILEEVQEEGYKYFGITDIDKIKGKETKEKLIKEYKHRPRLILSSKLNSKNKIMAINTWAVAIFRYSAGVLDCKDQELESVDRKTRKLMTLHRVLHPKIDVNRLDLKRQEER